MNTVNNSIDEEVPSHIIKLAFELNQKLISNISEKDFLSLEKNFNITMPIFEEIEEELNSVKLSPTAKPKIKNSHFQVFKYHDSDYGIEASIFTNDDEDTDLTLLTDLIADKSNDYYLQYRLIEVM